MDEKTAQPTKRPLRRGTKRNIPSPHTARPSAWPATCSDCPPKHPKGSGRD